MSKAPVIPIESITPAIIEAERFLQWVMNARGMDIPDQKVTLNIQTRGKRQKLCGWFSNLQWSTREGDMVHEITITAERLQGEVADILETLAHEAVHYWCAYMGLTDVSESGRHNKHTFYEKALVVGLNCKSIGDTKGYAYTSLTDEFRQDIEDNFQPDHTAFDLFRVVKTKEKKPTKMKKWSCTGCTPIVNVRVAKDFDARCNTCQTNFELQEETA